MKHLWVSLVLVYVYTGNGKDSGISLLNRFYYSKSFGNQNNSTRDGLWGLKRSRNLELKSTQNAKTLNPDEKGSDICYIQTRTCRIGVNFDAGVTRSNSFKQMISSYHTGTDSRSLVVCYMVC